MARREQDEQQNPNDPWGRPPGHPMYGMPPVDTGPSPYGPPIQAPPQAENPPPPNGGGTPIDFATGGPRFNTGPLLQPYGGQFTPPPYGNAFRNLSSLLGPAPSFTAPQLPTIDPFRETTGEDVFSDPSFGFRKDIGQNALVNSRAAQGLTRTGGTLKDLLAYNQNFASQEFGNVDSRRRETYNTNRDTQFGLYDRGFEGKQAEFEPKLFDWSTKANLGMRAEDNAYNNSFKEFQTDYDMWRNQQDDVFNRLKWSSEFGLDAATR